MNKNFEMFRELRMLIVCVLTLLIGVPASAQAPRFDDAGLKEMCLRGDCVFGVRASIDRLGRQGLGGAEFNSQLGSIASILFQAAEGADTAALTQLAEALIFLAQFSTDATQQQSFIWVAGQVASGAVDLFDLAAPFAVSPS